MKWLLIILMFFLYPNLSNAEWTQRFFAETSRTWCQSGNILYTGQVNGLTTYNFSTKEKKYFNSLTSALPGNYVNSILQLKDDTLLVSTNLGLAQIIDGVITNDEPICKTYPDTDARYLYLDSAANVWTFSATKVHRWNGSEWYSFDLADSIVKYTLIDTLLVPVPYPYEIMRLLVHNHQIWVQFNDKTKTQTTYYWNQVSDEYIKLAILDGDSIYRTFQTKEDFPYKQGSPKFVSINNDVILKSTDGIYLYKDSIWSLTNKFDVNATVKPNWYSDIYHDFDGNLWYYVSDNNAYRPTSYNIETGIVTEHLSEEEDKAIYGLNVMNNGKVIAYSQKYFYLKNDTGWVKINTEDTGIPINTNFATPNVFNNQVYVWFTTTKDSILRGTLFNIENSTDIKPYTEKSFYSTLTQFALNKYGKGIFKGRMRYSEPLQYEADTAFIKPNLINDSPKIRLAGDGLVYFNMVRTDDNTDKAKYMNTWNGNELIKVDMGFLDSNRTFISDFCVYNDNLFALGEYETGADSLNSFITIFNTVTKELRTYDKHNSCMPDFYYTRNGYWLTPYDTVTYAISAENEEIIWLSTKETIIRFSSSDCQYFNLPEGKPWLNKIIEYDNYSNELLCQPFGSIIFILNTITKTWDSLDLGNNTFNGKFVQFKKLLDNRIWASDDLGYMYRYEGNGKFIPFNLKIYGHDHLGITIHDFFIDANLGLHLGTDIGLLSNKDILTTIEDKVSTTDEILISPNPASEFIYLQIPLNFSTNENTLVEVFSVLGQKMISTQYKDRIDISSLPSGFYIIKVGDFTGKFVKGW